MNQAQLPPGGSPESFAVDLTGRSALRDAITAVWRQAEPEAVAGLLQSIDASAQERAAVQELAQQLARTLRERRAAAGRKGVVQALLQEFSLSSQEGVALMCLAEALLRIPDSATRDALIRDKIGAGNWRAHLGQSPSLFVNAAAWGLLLTGKLVATHSETGLSSALARLIRQGGEPLIRKGVDMAMRMMGEQFVMGQTIEEALANSRPMEAQGFRHSYDMLGEAALTATDAERYRAAYEHAIHAIGEASQGRGIHEGPGISIKLSALHPRYCRAQYGRVAQELYPVLLNLAQLAHRYDIGINIDAEEADRLELSLDSLERLCFEPSLAGWNGIGFVVQAYQKRCPRVLDYLIDLARRSQRRLMLRLVKGAYWDSEIKRAQIEGLPGYPVFTRKPHTDLSYIACARQLLAAPDAVFPQFATHNAHTLAAIYHMAGPGHHAEQYEFQCLHGMGEALYEQVVGAAAEGKLARPCRIYAPVGTHETLLAYLVRRLLENGANSSFVNQIADTGIPINVLVRDPIDAIHEAAAGEGSIGLPHPAIPLPESLYGEERRNSQGIDLCNDLELASLNAALTASASTAWSAQALLFGDGDADADGGPGWMDVRNPADRHDIVGRVREAQPAEIAAALDAACDAAPQWAAVAPAQRASALREAADALQAGMLALIGLLMREAGKTAANAIAEVREAVDFLRYYARQVDRAFDNASHVALGPIVCISPWNFPLAIFTGQVAAALAAGNTVLAKPAEQTPLIAAYAVRTLWASGVPRAALQLLPGRGTSVGAALVADARIRAVMFTGSTDVARLLQAQLAGRVNEYGGLIPLIAETGGQNAMIVDSSALAEQVVNDVMASAFDSAGQRCSALRVLCVQEEAADRVLEMLRHAMGEYRLGDPRRLATDIGPVIDADARDQIEKHVELMRAKGQRIWRSQEKPARELNGFFVAPTLIEIESIAELKREVFGPVLHVLRYQRPELPDLVTQINATGYGLTLGLHTRIDETVAQVLASAGVGNIYVNRNMVGAVVGVQPFGGEGLSGTGPKAGGPLYLLRLLARRPDSAARAAIQRCAQSQGDAAPPEGPPTLPLSGSLFGPLAALRDWALQQGRHSLASACEAMHADNPSALSVELAGPTGERNLYSTLPRSRTLCLADEDDDRLIQLAAALVVGSTAVWPQEAHRLHESLPAALRSRIELVSDWTDERTDLDVALHRGDATRLHAVCTALAQRSGPIVSVIAQAPGDQTVPLERLVIERSVSVNTAAAGGNASLMTIG